MSHNILPEPPDELKQLSRSLCDRIREEISSSGAISFSRFMEMALYEPGLGYYSAGLYKFGESGDFVTSPELGSLFAACLARQASEIAGVLGDYDILEIGAGSGAMAADLLLELTPERLPGRYRILERSADLRQVQRQRIAALAPHCLERVEWLDQPPDSPWQGLLIANEVLDALAVERFQASQDQLQQLSVKVTEDGFDWVLQSAPAELEETVRALGIEFPEDYRSEILLNLPAWLEAMTRCMSKGLALFIDYGYPRREYYLPQRSDGTLMCHYRHRAHDDVFFWPALQDITAWVDFTALAEASEACELELEGYTTQAMYLLGCGLEKILQEKTAASADNGMTLAAEVRQLTLPGMMGEKFQVMGLGRGIDQPLNGFSLLDLRYRL